MKIADAPLAANPSLAAPHRLRLLTIGPQDVCPPTDGGKEGIHGALAALARRAQVDYAYPSPSPRPDEASGYQAIAVEPLPVAFNPVESIPVIARATLTLKPFKFAKYSTNVAVERHVAALRDPRYDAIVCFHAHTFELGRKLRKRFGWNIPILVREHNIEYELVESYRRSLRPAARLLAMPFEALTRRAEQNMWETADATAFLTDRDLSLAQRTGIGGNLVLAPEGVPIPASRAPLKRPGVAPQLLVPLNQRATQSVANLKQFLNTHWRQACRRPSMSKVRLAVTGVKLDRLSELMHMPASELGAMRVDALGFLPSLAPAFAASLALVSPTFVGGGIRQKVLEGMANELPVIATDLDIDTCHFFDPPRNILRLGDVDQFVQAVSSLLDSDSAWRRLAEEGRATVERFASWDNFAGIVIDEIGRLVGNRAR